MFGCHSALLSLSLLSPPSEPKAKGARAHAPQSETFAAHRALHTHTIPTTQVLYVHAPCGKPYMQAAREKPRTGDRGENKSPQAETPLRALYAWRARKSAETPRGSCQALIVKLGPQYKCAQKRPYVEGASSHTATTAEWLFHRTRSSETYGAPSLCI